MTQDLFNVPIFFIVLRETIEAAVIVSVLLSFVEQIMATGKLDSSAPPTATSTTTGLTSFSNGEAEAEDETKRRKNLVKRMRIQIWAGTLTGFGIALAIGAAFIAVFYTTLTDLWANTEEIWEGVFSIIAAIIIYLMGIAFLKMDRSRIKWRLKLAEAFEKSHSKAIAATTSNGTTTSPSSPGTSGRQGKFASWKDERRAKKEARNGKWALFILPLVTVLREGLEAIVFVGGVSLNASGKSIPIPAICGLLCGGLIGYIIYRTGSTASLHWFLIGSTSIIFLIGAGLASKAVGLFEYYVFATGVGSDVAEVGNGPGSFQVAGNVWHLTYGNPETNAPGTNGGWQLFNALLGWNNTATLGSVLTYVFYWILIIVTLLYFKWKEGRVSCFGRTSKAYKQRMAAKERGPERSRSTPALYGRVSNEDLDAKYAEDEPAKATNGVPTLEINE